MADPDPRKEPALGLFELLFGIADQADDLDARRRRDQGGEPDGE